MSILLIFGFGVLLLYYLLLEFFTVMKKKMMVNIGKIETDITDYDGGGNYGRIPDKKPKNRAI